MISEPCACNITEWKTSEASSPAEHIADRVEDEEEMQRDTTVSAVHAHTKTYLGVVIGFVVVVFLLVSVGLMIYVRRLRKKKSSPHVLKSPMSDTGSVAFDMRSLRLTSSYSGAGAAMYGPVAVPDEEGSLYHEPYKTPLFSASEYSVATIGRQFNEYTEGVTNTPAHTIQPQSGGAEYAVPILSTPPSQFNTSASTCTGFSNSQSTQFNTTTPLSAPTTPFSHGTTPHTSVSTPFM